jgi:hypothetical protein
MNRNTMEIIDKVITPEVAAKMWEAADDLPYLVFDPWRDIKND